jgi:hypothetical protein
VDSEVVGGAEITTAWVYKAVQRTYQNQATNRVLTQADLVRLRDTYADRKMGPIRQLTTNLANNQMSLGSYERAMREHLRTLHLSQHALGRGGANRMGFGDYGQVGRALRDQYGYLRGFVQDIGDGKLTGPQMLARADQYIGSATAAFERGQARAWGATLPAYPGDGGTECLGNCRCHWSYDERMDLGTHGELHCTWRLGGSDPCDGCSRRASDYQPYIIRYTS